MIIRNLQKSIQAKIGKGKTILLLGARQVGKSTLLRNIFEDEKNILWLDAENPDIPELFKNATNTSLTRQFSNYKIVIIDEAQKIENIGSVLKLFTDYLKNTQVIATGSSSFEIKNKTNEPLTGRKWEYHLFPLSFSEMVEHTNVIEEKRLLTHRLIYGYYPEIVVHDDDLALRLKTLSESYLYKDILMWQDIKKPDKLVQLLKALAMQVGSEVNYHELGNIVGLKNDTVEKYIQLLEQTFVIFRLPAYSTNQRKELKKGKKIYFFDNGIRNAILGDFKLFETRQDKGALFENFVICELYKKHSYEGKTFQCYFWRTADQQEIDLIIEKEGILNAYEIKWNPGSKAKLSKTFSKVYPNHTFQVINAENIVDFM
ncbi:MAG: ATP-binding protein [Bacteroidetes bacterium]|nr:ATP-binding protein [Bacteroidota bacterium]